VSVNAANDVQLVGNVIVQATDGVNITASARPARIGNTIDTTSGTNVNLSTATAVVIRANQIAGGGTGIAIGSGTSGQITDNDIALTSFGVNISTAFTGAIRGNRIHSGGIGVQYAAAADLSANLIYDNATGVVATVNSTSGGLGYVAGSVPITSSATPPASTSPG